MKVNTVYEGDCLEIMRQFPDNCIDTILTDPPYGLSFMGKNWDHGLPGVAYWRECLRVAKPGAMLMAFGGTRTYHRLVCAIEDAGWQIRDCISYFHDGNQAEQAFMASLNKEQLAAYLELHYPNRQMSWVYGSGIGLGLDISKAIDKANGAEREVVGRKIDISSGKPVSVKQVKGGTDHNLHEGWDRPWRKDDEHAERMTYITAPATPLAKQFAGWNTRLKPGYEPIVVAQKPLDGTYAENAEKWGLSGIWVDGCRIETGGENPKPGGKIRSKRGKFSRQDIDYKLMPAPDSHPKGRYPANVIHSGEPGVLAEFDKGGVRPTGKPTRGEEHTIKNVYNGNGWKRSLVGGGDSGSAARYYAQCPPDEPARFRYCPKAGPKERATPGNNHPTQKPLSLIRYLARLTKTPTGGIVLDPFAGSGTTALACIPEGRDYVLIEKEPEYAEICRRRVAEYTGQEVAEKEIELSKEENVRQLALW